MKILKQGNHLIEDYFIFDPQSSQRDWYGYFGLIGLVQTGGFFSVCIGLIDK